MHDVDNLTAREGDFRFGPALAPPLRIATLHDEAIAYVAIPLRLITDAEMSKRPERVILLPRGLDEHDNERPGMVGKPDRADALAGAPMHDGHSRIFCVKRDACIEIARSQCDMSRPEVWHRKSSRFDVRIAAA